MPPKAPKAPKEPAGEEQDLGDPETGDGSDLELPELDEIDHGDEIDEGDEDLAAAEEAAYKILNDRPGVGYSAAPGAGATESQVTVGGDGTVQIKVTRPGAAGGGGGGGTKGDEVRASTKTATKTAVAPVTAPAKKAAGPASSAKKAAAAPVAPAKKPSAGAAVKKGSAVLPIGKPSASAPAAAAKNSAAATKKATHTPASSKPAGKPAAKPSSAKGGPAPKASSKPKADDEVKASILDGEFGPIPEKSRRIKEAMLRRERDKRRAKSKAKSRVKASDAADERLKDEGVLSSAKKQQQQQQQQPQEGADEFPEDDGSLLDDADHSFEGDDGEEDAEVDEDGDAEMQGEQPKKKRAAGKHPLHRNIVKRQDQEEILDSQIKSAEKLIQMKKELDATRKKLAAKDNAHREHFKGTVAPLLGEVLGREGGAALSRAIEGTEMDPRIISRLESSLVKASQRQKMSSRVLASIKRDSQAMRRGGADGGARGGAGGGSSSLLEKIARLESLNAQFDSGKGSSKGKPKSKSGQMFESSDDDGDTPMKKSSGKSAKGSASGSKKGAALKKELGKIHKWAASMRKAGWKPAEMDRSGPGSIDDDRPGGWVRATGRRVSSKSGGVKGITGSKKGASQKAPRRGGASTGRVRASRRSLDDGGGDGGDWSSNDEAGDDLLGSGLDEEEQEDGGGDDFENSADEDDAAELQEDAEDNDIRMRQAHGARGRGKKRSRDEFNEDRDEEEDVRPQRRVRGAQNPESKRYTKARPRAARRDESDNEEGGGEHDDEDSDPDDVIPDRAKNFSKRELKADSERRRLRQQRKQRQSSETGMMGADNVFASTKRPKNGWDDGIMDSTAELLSNYHGQFGKYGGAVRMDQFPKLVDQWNEDQGKGRKKAAMGSYSSGYSVRPIDFGKETKRDRFNPELAPQDFSVDRYVPKVVNSRKDVNRGWGGMQQFGRRRRDTGAD